MKTKPILPPLRARWKNTISNRQGSVLVYSIGFFIGVLFLFFLFFEKYRLNVMIDNVQNDVTTVLTSTAANNLYQSYASVRDGTSGTFVYDGREFTEIQDVSRFTALFPELFADCRASGSSLIFYHNGQVQFELTNLSLSVENAPVSATRSSYLCRYDLTVYQRLLWQTRAVRLPGQRQLVQYVGKF